MQKDQKEQVVAELTERLRESQTLLVADYRGLTMTEIDALRGRLLEHGARFSVVKNTLTRRAAEAAGADALLALLDGPTAIAFLESGGDSLAVAKALADAARDTRILTIRGGVLGGCTSSRRGEGGGIAMAASAVDTIFDKLGGMTVLELVELKNKIEEEWGITAAAPVAVAAPGAAAGGGDGAAAEEQTAFDVVLTG